MVKSHSSLFRSKKKLGFLDGAITCPDPDSDDLEDWYAVNSMLVSWIFNTIEPTMRSTISYMENILDLWLDIREHFGVTNGPRIQQLKAELSECKQGAKSISDYCGRMKRSGSTWMKVILIQRVDVGSARVI